MDPSDRLVLPDEVLVFPVADLPPPVRAAIGCDPGDYAITRERSRRTTRVVDRAAADLIEEFRRPSSAADAIFRFIQRAELETEEVVDGCVPMLNEFIADGFLVPVGMERAAIDDHLLRVGEMIGGWEVLEPLQIVEDTEVYRVKSTDGVEAALKRVSADAESWVRGALRNELRILGRLQGETAPTPLEDGTAEDEPYLVIPAAKGTIQVIGEDQHMDWLARYVADQPRYLVVSLHLVPAQVGPRSTGYEDVEVRLDGRRVGSLSTQMSAEVSQLVSHAVGAGKLPVCRAVLRGSPLRAELTLHAAKSSQVTSRWLQSTAST